MEIIKEDGVKDVVTTDDHKYVNPKMFTVELPVIVLCDDLRSFVGWAIKAHTSGNYNHAFIMHKPGMLVSQNFTGFAENNIDVYMKNGMMLKFWRVKNMSDDEKNLIYTAIRNRLALPWCRRSYDFLGTFVGQFFHIKWIQNPFQTFCSEQVNLDYIAQIPRARAMKLYEPSPTDLNTYFMNNLNVMECLGYWWRD